MDIRKTICYLVMSIGIISCTYTRQVDTTKNNIANITNNLQEYIPVGDSIYNKIVWLGAIDNHADKLLQLVMTDISKKEFDKYKNQYTPLLSNDSSRIHINWTDSTFSFKSSDKIITYPIYDRTRNIYNYPEWWVEYKGYIPEISLYILENWHSGEFMIGESFWVDSLTNTRYNISVNTDGPASVPLLSPNQDRMIVSATYEWDEYPSVFVIRITRSNKAYTLENYACLHINENTESISDISINDIIWIDNNTFLLKLETHNPPKELKYKKVELPSE
ncbi:hypothetical protein LJC00_02860, partial [Dysgonomonas sp. OttesenSCG-928-M03]|nr:hypothetical protein [Dysgonomonas sp. OttesenSCG-928-M03]